MAAADPTYPLFPIACMISAAMLLLVLMTGFVRQSWNLGVVFLCFWLCVQCMIYAANTIVWSDNYDVRLYIYCDIGMPASSRRRCTRLMTSGTTVTHVAIITTVVKPMATLIILRRPYIIIENQSVKPPNESAVSDRAIPCPLFDRVT